MPSGFCEIVPKDENRISSLVTPGDEFGDVEPLVDVPFAAVVVELAFEE